MGLLALLHLAAGTALSVAAWLLPRRVAGARRARPSVLLLDLTPAALGTGILVLATARPIFAGTLVLALGAAFALTDRTMRDTLREPVVFSEAVELPQVFTHPHLYLPFAGPRLVLGGAAAAVLLELALLVAEPPLWAPHPVLALVAVALVAAGFWRLLREPWLGGAAALMHRLGPVGEPFEDAAALGPFAMLTAHTLIARAERRSRQEALRARPLESVPSPARPLRREQAAGVPIIVVQCESFFDARRLSPLVPRTLLPGFDACRAAAITGRFAVPCWGANTMRSEFAVVSGLPDSALGYDRFNPYYALARVPIESQAWRLRRAGYRTLCLHPFDRRFFRRDVVMPALGFERFLGRETIGGSRVPPYCPDPDLARQILRVLDAEGPHTFIFAITMGNHGPWTLAGPPLDPAVAALFAPTAIPGGGGLLRYLDGLRRSDEMLQILLDGLIARDRPAILAVYGDHLPSFGTTFDHFGFTDSASDYAIWRAGQAPQRRDIAAHELGHIVVDAALGTAPPASRQACAELAQPATMTQ